MLKFVFWLFQFQILTETLTKTNQFSKLIKPRMPNIHKYLFIRQKPNFMLLYYFAHYVNVEYFNISVDIVQSLPASHRITPNFNFNKLPYKISLTYVTFTAQWNGNAIILGIDYDRFFIFKHCSFGSNKRKYVPFESFKCLAYLYIMCASPISIGF